MPDPYRETYVAEIEVKLPPAGALKKQLEKYEELAEQTITRIEGAFRGMRIQLPQLDPFKAFGQEIGGFNIGPLGGVSNVTQAQVRDLADALQRLTDRAGIDLKELAENFENFSASIAEGMRLSPDIVERSLGEGLRQAIAYHEGAVDDIQKTWLLLAHFLYGGSILQEIEANIDHYMSMIPNITEERMAELRNALVIPFLRAAEETEGSLKELNAVWNRTLSQMFRGGDLGGGEFRFLANAVKEVDTALGDVARQTHVENRFLSITDAIRQTGLSYKELLQNVRDGTLKIDESGQITAASFKRLNEQIQKSKDSVDNMGSALYEFNTLMKTATRQTTGWREGLSLAAGGDVLLGLRTALDGTGEATSKVTKGIDLLRRGMAKLQDDTTAEERALVNNLTAYQKREIALRNAVNRIKDYGAEIDVSKSSLDQFTESVRVQLNAVRRQTQSAIANKEITAQGVAELENSTTVIREQIAALRLHAAEQIKDNEAYGDLLDQVEKSISQTERELEITKARNRQAKESRDEVDKETKAQKDRGSILDRLIKKMTSFKRTTDDVDGSNKRLTSTVRAATAPMRAMGNAVDITNRSLFKLVGIFTTINTGFEIMREGVRRVTDSIRSFKDEFLGFGVINDFMDQLTTGVVEFAAESRQAQFAVRFMGEQLAIATGRDSQAAVDGLVQKMEQLQEQGVGVRESSELVKRALTVGFPIGPIGEATDELLRVDTTLEELIVAYRENRIGLETVARAAQNWSTVMGGSSSEIADKFLQASIRMKTEILETNGLAKNASVLWEEYVQAINRVDEGSERTVKSLSDEEKQIATLLGEIIQTLPAAGAYEQAMGGIGDSVDTTGKLIGSMSRYVDNAKLALGDVFLPVLRELLLNLKEFLKRVEEIAKSPAMQRLGEAFTRLAANIRIGGPIISFMIDHFEEFAKSITTLINAMVALGSGETKAAIEGFGSFFVDAITGIALVMDKTIKKALVWGYNLVANLANSMIEAAQTLLVRAANLIGDIVGLFFAPGSPPKQGPLKNIAKWGAGLTQTLADSMSQAAPAAFANTANVISEAVAGSISGSFRDLDLTSFRIIRDSVGQIQGVLQSMVSRGIIDETELAPGLQHIRDLMIQLANQFEETGEISEDVLSQIGDRLGEAGADIEQYIRLQFQLQKAQQELKDIDEEIAAAEASGFVPAALRRRRKDAEERLNELQEQFDLQRELIAWQKESNDLVQQQVDLLQRIADQTARAAEAAERGQADQWEAFLERYNDELAALEKKRDLGIITEEEYNRSRLSLEQQYIDNAIKLGKPLEQARIDQFLRLKALVDAARGGAGAGIDDDDPLGLGDKGSILDPLIATTEERIEDVRAQIGGVTQEFADMRERVENILRPLGAAISNLLAGRFEHVLEYLKWKFGIDFDEIKANIQTKILEAFEGLRAKIDARLKPIKERIKVAFDEIGDYIPLVIGGALAAAFVLPKLAGIADAFGGIGNLLLAPVQSALSPLTGVISRLSGVLLGPLVAGLKAAGAGLVALLGPVGATIAIVGLLVGGFLIFRDRIDEVADSINSVLTPVLSVLEPIVSRVFNLISDVVTNAAGAFQAFIKRVLSGETVNRFLDRLLNLAKILGTVLGGLVAGILLLAEKIIYLVSDALEPFAEVAGFMVKGLLDLATVIIDTVVGPVEILFRLFTEGPESAGRAILNLIGDIKRVIPAVAAMVAAWKFGIPTPIGAIIGGLKSIQGNLTLVQVALSEFRDSVVVVLQSVIARFGALTTAVRTFAANPIPAMQAGWSGMMTAISSSTLLTGGVVLAAVAAWGIAIKKFVEVFDEARAGAEQAQEAMADWSGQALQMSEDGKSASAVVNEFANRLNEARRQFDKAGPITDIFAGGKDIDIFTRGAREANEAIISVTGSYEDYIQRVEQFNRLVDVEEMQIKTMTREQYNFRISLQDSTSAMDRALVIVGGLSDSNNVFARGLEYVNSKLEEQEKEQRSTARAAQDADVAMLNSARHQTALADAARKATRDQEALRQAIEDVTRSGLTMDTSAVTSAIEGRTGAYERYLSDRNELISTYNDQAVVLEQEGNSDALAELTNKHNLELAEIDRRYAEEDKRRKAEIGRALLDLNDRLLRERLMVDGLTTDQVVAIEDFHRTRAQQIGGLYDIDIEQRYAGTTAELLRAYALTGDEIEKDTGATIEQLLLTFDKLNEDGFGALTTRQQEWVTEASISNAKYLSDVGATSAEVIASLGLIPSSFHEDILEMLGEKKTIDEIVAALGGLDKVIETKIEINYAPSKSARDPLLLQSPKTQLQSALEALVSFSENNTVQVLVEMTEGVMEYLGGVSDGMVELADTSGESERSLRTILRTIRDIFWRLHDDVVGPAGAVTRMILLIQQKFQSLTSSYGILGQFASEVVRIFSKMGSDAAFSLASGLGSIYTYFDQLFSYSKSIPWLDGRAGLYETAFWKGDGLMQALARGIVHGITTHIASALAQVQRYIDDNWPSPPHGRYGDLGIPITGSIPGNGRVRGGFVTNRVIHIENLYADFPSVRDRYDAADILRDLERKVENSRLTALSGA